MAPVPPVPIPFALFIASVIVCNYNDSQMTQRALPASAGGSALARMEPRPDLVRQFSPHHTANDVNKHIFINFFSVFFLLCAVYDFCCFYEATDDDRPIVR